MWKSNATFLPSFTGSFSRIDVLWKQCKKWPQWCTMSHISCYCPHAHKGSAAFQDTLEAPSPFRETTKCQGRSQHSLTANDSAAFYRTDSESTFYLQLDTYCLGAMGITCVTPNPRRLLCVHRYRNFNSTVRPQSKDFLIAHLTSVDQYQVEVLKTLR